MTQYPEREAAVEHGVDSAFLQSFWQLAASRKKAPETALDRTT